ncbi:MAG TPA: ABC transporter ATP-binding protein [Hypericibacter adhaerens]|jgi:multiple sugar transport system ATP-binding protein|uniref:ABC transporter ATP-binding protein n=1 Tax=Hypericibacter adhaerens TaxID=2602016 RepID=A0A5J6N051_9PROT|nr:ABC transporter ATP-binding protein [Hypericibacter adhaerens]QEX23061.1 ABC transporter ATP-binding protein [Hypericibacter adhaerens]HWA44208.1 ABC transporter ATP-binding protein [Hypericibacter adhaerens]
MAEIRIENLHRRFGDFVAVRDSNLTIRNGDFFVLLGPSGCGKTTTLRMIAGLEIPTSGRILLDGEDVTFLRASHRDIAFVFQLFALYPHMNVGQNLAFPLKSQGTPRAEVKARVAEVARLLRIEHLLHSPVGRLAGGDRQRVALGRAIIRRPKAFLMDEPLGTLDAEFRDLMREELRQLHERIGATTVYVTHDQIEAMSMADQIAVMDKGVILQAGPPNEVYRRPATMFVAGFIGSPAMNFLPVTGPVAAGAQTIAVNGAHVTMPKLHEPLNHDRGVLGARPEHMELADAASFRGRVFGVEYLGARQLVTVDTSVGRVKVRAANTGKAKAGDTVGIDFRSEALVLFDGRTERALASDLMNGAPVEGRRAAHG